MTNLHVFESKEALAEAAAAAIAAVTMESQERGIEPRLALSGGRTPVDAYRLLGLGRAGIRAHWSRVTVFFADERDAPPNEPESNYWEVRKLFLEPAHVPPERVHRMRADDPDLEGAARAYERLLDGPLELLVLGIGEDGHTASLFPGSPWIAERERRVVAVLDSPKPPPSRLSIAPRVIAEARQVLVLASGAEKASAVARALAAAGDSARVPARLARERLWYVDREAAGRL